MIILDLRHFLISAFSPNNILHFFLTYQFTVLSSTNKIISIHFVGLTYILKIVQAKNLKIITENIIYT